MKRFTRSLFLSTIFSLSIIACADVGEPGDDTFENLDDSKADQIGIGQSDKDPVDTWGGVSCDECKYLNDWVWDCYYTWGGGASRRDQDSKQFEECIEEAVKDDTECKRYCKREG